MPKKTKKLVAFILTATIAIALGAILVGGIISTTTQKYIPNLSQRTTTETLDPKKDPHNSSLWRRHTSEKLGSESSQSSDTTIIHITRGPEALAMTAIYLDAKVAYEPEGYQDILESVGTSEKATNAEKVKALRDAFERDQSLFEHYQTVYRDFLRSLVKS